MKIQCFIFIGCSFSAGSVFCGGDNQASKNKLGLCITAPKEDDKPEEEIKSPSWYTSAEYFALFADKKKKDIKSFVDQKLMSEDLITDSKSRQVFTSEDLRNPIVLKKYKRKKDGKTLELKECNSPIEKAFYLGIDTCHNEFEAYDKRGNHLGAIRPDTLELYKDPVLGRKINR
ncbi:hypothetical protein EBR77_02120 [bacterium]|nr:hypothetical protein [bacterium]NBX77863.1 hypothetical protein [bacterium]